LADNVALLAARRAAAWLRLTAGRAAIDRYLLAAGPTAANPQLQRAAVRWDRQTDRQTDGRTPDSCIYPAPRIQYTMRAVPKISNVKSVKSVFVFLEETNPHLRKDPVSAMRMSPEAVQ